MPCSYWAYIDASSGIAASVRIESTCSLYGPHVADLTGSWLAEPAGSKLVLEYSVPAATINSMKATPCTPAPLPQPWPPYGQVDAEVIVDSRPGLNLYGLPIRRSTVLTLTLRTVLEGRVNGLQLVAVDASDVGSGAEAYVDGWLVVATVPPLLSRLPDLEDARRCAARREGLDGWGRCLWERGRGYSEKLLASMPAGPWTRACLYTRFYAGSLVEAGVEPLSWLRRVRSEAGPWRPVELLGSVLAVYAPRARIALARMRDGVFELREESVKEGIRVIEGWDAVGLACRSCLEPLRRS